MTERSDGYMRVAMPVVAGFVDDLRHAFGRLDVDSWVRRGIADGSFHASEGGQQIGQSVPPPDNAISVRDLVLVAAVKGRK